MIAYTGIETVSNLAEEARDPPRDVPRSIRLVAVAVFAIYFTLPLIALSALPVHELVNGEYQTLLGLPPEEGGFANDPVLGLVEEPRPARTLLDVLEIYVGILAATILFIATNAGVIGASRITYAMASYRQLPEVFRRLHPRFKTPWLSLVVFAGIASIAVILPGQTNFLGTMYSFGAMLSFTIAHASIVALRVRGAGRGARLSGRPNLRVRGVDWPLFAILGGIGTGLAWLVIVVQRTPTRWVGLGWLVLGFVVYVIYRRRVVQPRCARRCGRRRSSSGLAVEYRHDPRARSCAPPSRRRRSSPPRGSRPSAGRRSSSCTSSRCRSTCRSTPSSPTREDERRRAPRRGAGASSRRYGVRRIVTRLVRARRAGPAIVEEAVAPRRRAHRHRRAADEVARRQADLRPHGRPRPEGQPLPRPPDAGRRAA